MRYLLQWCSDAYMPLLTLILFVLIWRYVRKRETPLLVYLVISVLLMGFAAYQALNGINNLYMYNTYNIIEFCFATLIISRAATGKNFSKQFFFICIPVVILCLLDLFWWESWSTFNSMALGITYLTIIVHSMYYLLKLSNTEEILYFQTLPSFWVISAFLVYCSISFLVMISYKYFVSPQFAEQAKNIMRVYIAAVIIKFVMISIGLLCYYKRPYSRLHS